jgi:adenylate cyclase class 2
MATEVEIKLRCSDHEAARRALTEAGAEPLGRVMEQNTFLDTPEARLSGAGCGFRMRRKRRLDDAGADKFVVTFKGPRQPSAVKSREEHEFGVTDPDAALAAFKHLGFGPTLVFEKVRESYHLDGCTVELDELPQLGTFAEIEGPDETAVLTLRRKLGWDELPQEDAAYSTMIAAHLREHGGTELRFDE